MAYINTVETTNDLLTQNSEWINRYTVYANKIINNHSKHIEGRKKLRVQSPLYLYTCIGNLLDDNILNYDLRFLGQSIAGVKVKNDDVIIHTKRAQKEANLRYFGIDTTLNKEEWSGYRARKFRSAFNKCESIQGRSNEHKIEAGLLSEFSKRDGRAKSLRNIQPVVLANCFFQMATPLQASLHDIQYSAHRGGGIDILARVKAHFHLAILAYWIVSTTQYQLKKKGVSHTWREILRIGNTQSVVTTIAKRVDNQLVEIRQCTEPEQKLAGIYEKLNMHSLPLKRKRKICVVHFDNTKNKDP